MYSRWGKRCLDVLISFSAFLALSWLLIPCMMILLCTGEHYIFYRQQRIGFGGKSFRIFKFATMLLNSPNMPGGTITTRNDKRILPFGKFLRKTKINELPQIFNVMNGTMSIVGPRPLVPEGFELYSPEIRKQIFQIKPGITGIGSLVFRDEEKYLSMVDNPHEFYQSRIMPYKGSLEIWYQQRISLITDLKIIFLTAWLIVFPQCRIVFKMFPDLPKAPDWLNWEEGKCFR